mgnify:CR=1 FL=1
MEFHHMRHIIIAAVGDGGTQVGNLQRREVNLALTNTDTDDRQAVPRALVSLVVETSVGYESAFLTRKVDAQAVAKAHAHHVVAPGVHGVLHRAVLTTIGHHVIQSPTEEGVARRADGRHDGQGRRMTVASHMQAFIREATMARGTRYGY